MQSSMQTDSLIPAVLCPNSTPSETNSTYVLNAAIWFLDVWVLIAPTVMACRVKR